MITSADNSQLKLLRRLQRKRERDETGLFAAEGEDLVEAARLAGWEPELLLRAGEDVEPELLRRAGSLGSGSRVVGVYRMRHSEPGGRLSVYLHGVRDPGNVGAVLRSAHALCDGPVVLGPGCADPFGPKAVRASMGSLFPRPPARADFTELDGSLVALTAGAGPGLADVRPRAAGGGVRGRGARGAAERARVERRDHGLDPSARGGPRVAQRRHGGHRGSVRARN